MDEMDHFAHFIKGMYFYKKNSYFVSLESKFNVGGGGLWVSYSCFSKRPARAELVNKIRSKTIRLQYLRPQTTVHYGVNGEFVRVSFFLSLIPA